MPKKPRKLNVVVAGHSFVRRLQDYTCNIHKPPHLLLNILLHIKNMLLGSITYMLLRVKVTIQKIVLTFKV